jgi:hypothetical protein
MELLQKK